MLGSGKVQKLTEELKRKECSEEYHFHFSVDILQKRKTMLWH